jgi:hypothetical protein
MEKKVVVMSGADVAAMRKAHKDAETAYFKAKVGALEFAVEEMTTTGKEYSVGEIAGMTGLTPGEVVAQFGITGIRCRAATEAGLNRSAVSTWHRHSERQFVEVLPNGEINPNHIINIARRETVIKVTPNRR